MKFLWKGIYLEGEAVNIRGKSSGLALPGTYDPASELPNPLYKDINIWGWAGRTGYIKPEWQGIFEAGFAGGDDNVADSKFTGRNLHPDYNVGLLLYEEVLARVTARSWSTGALPLWSHGGSIFTADSKFSGNDEPVIAAPDYYTTLKGTTPPGVDQLPWDGQGTATAHGCRAS